MVAAVRRWRRCGWQPRDMHGCGWAGRWHESALLRAAAKASHVECGMMFGHGVLDEVNGRRVEKNLCAMPRNHERAGSRHSPWAAHPLALRFVHAGNLKQHGAGSGELTAVDGVFGFRRLVNETRQTTTQIQENGCRTIAFSTTTTTTASTTCCIR